MSALRRLWRLPAVVALLLAGLLIQVVAFPWAGARRRERIVRRWSRLLLGACGVRLRARARDAGELGEATQAGDATQAGGDAAALPPGSLVVANHLSWLDIFAIDALAPTEFVAKAEIRGWPLIGWLCALAGTHFIERHRRHAVRDVIGRMSAALRDGRRVGVFPEGGVGDGTALLRFHANLLQAAIEAQAPVVPVALRYRDAAGGASRATLYVGGTTFVQSLWRIIGEPATVAELVVLAPIAPAQAAERATTRHLLALRAESSIRAALGLAP